ncbi:hypothetical protein [Leptospira levettii]|uniref:hypothetical protein n=1 Tax=Leptospira levettii TaxID=2023178 RepID=UPI00223D5781|nr:hypothetical protein [Leptospira levettii]MCW7475591.1 hypothetical protein [Leptospira levettii]
MKLCKFVLSILIICTSQLYGETNSDYNIRKNRDYTSITVPAENKNIILYIDIYKSGDYAYGLQENMNKKVEIKYVIDSNNRSFSPVAQYFNKDGTSKVIDFGDLLESRCIWGNCKNGSGLVSNMAIFSLGNFINQSLDGLGIQENLDSTLTIGNWKGGALNKFCMLIDVRNKFIIIIKSDAQGLIKISEKVNL